jgi:hypothetical protein
MKKIILLLLLAISMLQSCSNAEIIANDAIDVALRQTIKIKNDSLMQAMANNDYSAYMALGAPKFTDKLLANSRKVASPFRNHFYKPEYVMYDEYYIKDVKPWNTTELKSEKHKYTYTFLNNEKESYISLLKASGYQFDVLVTVKYGLIDKKWKICGLDINHFGNFGTTVADFYKLAKENEAKGRLLNAYTFARNALEGISNDEEANLKWDEEYDIKFYSRKLEMEVRKKYNMPFVLTNVATRPTLLYIEPRAILEGIVPAISYHTNIDMNDTEALDTENAAIKRELHRIFKNDINFRKTIVYRAHPDDAGNERGYDIIDKK